MNIEQQRASFEAWLKFSPLYMEDGEYVLSNVQLRFEAYQAALESPEVQAWKKDAERYQKLRAMATQQANTIGPIFRIDVQRTPQTLFDFDAAVEAAMEKQK